jgi:hypothetical protein
VGVTSGVREVCFLIGREDSVMWADTSDSPLALPDKRERWEQIWLRRETIVEIAHSHPVGPAAFSAEDHTTMVAIDAAVGRPLRYAIVTPDAVVRTGQAHDGEIEDQEPWWVALLRASSGILP